MLSEYGGCAVERPEEPHAAPVLPENAPLVSDVQHDHQPLLRIPDRRPVDFMGSRVRKLLEHRRRQNL